jgi:hypothetical protein
MHLFEKLEVGEVRYLTLRAPRGGSKIPTPYFLSSFSTTVNNLAKCFHVFFKLFNCDDLLKKIPAIGVCTMSWHFLPQWFETHFRIISRTCTLLKLTGLAKLYLLFIAKCNNYCYLLKPKCLVTSPDVSRRHWILEISKQT